jgi:ferredoxin
MWGVGGLAGAGRDAGLIRPPGALDEERFLARCIRCGQCMRICPGNIIQPALLEAGVQGLWTPAVNYRIGRSGCQPNCIACGQVCPTAAIRPLSLDEKQGTGDFAAQGPIRMGTAFVDRGRCLPWAMDRPCLVCHELCPVSPKAIFTRTSFETIRDGQGSRQSSGTSVIRPHPHRGEPGQRRLLLVPGGVAEGALAHHRVSGTGCLIVPWPKDLA